MANPASDLRSAIATYLGTLTGLSGKVTAITAPSDAFGLAVKAGGEVFVCYDGLREEGGKIIGTARTPVRLTFSICAVATSFASPTAAQSKTLGTDQLTELIRGVRGQSFTAGGTAGVILLLRSEEVVEHPDRLERGGPVMVVCRYETTPLLI